jgi:(1->4)-alpha-D-glucan 1-alpha-D-glucosylmutase
MSDHESLIERLGALLGIEPSYADAFGRSVETSTETRRAILAGLGLDVATEEAARRSLAEVEALRHGPVPALIPVEAGRPVRIPLRGADEAVWRLAEEGGATREGRAAGGGLDLTPLPPGYHRLRVEAGDRRVDATVIAAPAACWEPGDMAAGTRLWGVTAQVYGLRSSAISASATTPTSRRPPAARRRSGPRS